MLKQVQHDEGRITAFDTWHKAFDVRDGKLYLPPEQRIRVW
jgi:predicted metalloendopeptidase